MEAIQDQFQTIVDGFIDFKGQKLAEKITTYTLTVSFTIAFILGFITQDIRYTLYTGLVGTGVTFLAVVPAWPYFNRNPVSFVASGSRTTTAASGSGGGVTGGNTIIVDGKEVTIQT